MSIFYLDLVTAEDLIWSFYFVNIVSYFCEAYLSFKIPYFLESIILANLLLFKDKIVY
jgi:hypothetical protein